MASVDYANELPDSQTIVNAHAEALINLLPSIATFLKDRIAYASPLSPLGSHCKADIQDIDWNESTLRN